MKVLLTGGAGFIGSHIVKLLLDQSHKVTVFDNFSTSLKTNIDSRASLIEGDLKDSESLKNALTGMDAVIHMASFISVEESVKNPLKYMENNVLGTANLLHCMRESKVSKIVFSSSATVYGSPKSLPILEDAPLSAANPYAASKIAIEALCESFSKTDNFDVIILRYFNPYGPGENHQPETHAIPNFIKAGLNKQPIPLYWKGEQVRDFIYVEDLAQAHISALELSGYQVFNVGSENGVKIIDVVNQISDILGYELEVEDKGERLGDVMETYASSEKLKQATGWEAKTNLADGLKKTVEYFKQNS